jgi:hypothetical protein
MGSVRSRTFSELHTRIVAAPTGQVWDHCLNVTSSEVRALGPLMAIRELPHRLARRRSGFGRTDAEAGEAQRPPSDGDRPLLDLFAEAEFTMLRRDSAPDAEGTASVIFGGAGRFWSPVNNQADPFDSPEAFIEFDDPGFAKIVARLDAVDLGDGTTRLETETVVFGTDAAAARKFAPYWALIRLPSGLIRRSWLAAIERRALSTLETSADATGGDLHRPAEGSGALPVGPVRN